MDVFEGNNKECRRQLTKTGGNELKFYEVGLALQALFPAVLWACVPYPRLEDRGSLVYPLYFLTNHSQAFLNRSDFPVIGQLCLSNMVDVSADEFLSGTNCVLERFHIYKFEETQPDAVLKLLKEKDALVWQPTTSGKLVIFQSFPNPERTVSKRYCRPTVAMSTSQFHLYSCSSN